MLAVAARAANLKPEIAGLGFLVGSWSSDTGKVADTGGRSKGSSVFTAEANGAALLRRDHVDLFDKAGKPAGAFDILMTIYVEKGAVHADYIDGNHVIHYTSAIIVPGESVTFATGAAPGIPCFRLIYAQTAKGLAISFSLAPPGQTAFRSIADGTLLKAG
jgi:hypothetical protein